MESSLAFAPDFSKSGGLIAAVAQEGNAAGPVVRETAAEQRVVRRLCLRGNGGAAQSSQSSPSPSGDIAASAPQEVDDLPF